MFYQIIIAHKGFKSANSTGSLLYAGANFNENMTDLRGWEIGVFKYRSDAATNRLNSNGVFNTGMSHKVLAADTECIRSHFLNIITVNHR